MILLYIFLALIFILILLAVVAPKKYDVNRMITINKPIDEVFNYLKFIKNQDEWSPWKKKDPNMKQDFMGSDGEVGFIAKWEGNKDVGTGEQELLRIVDNEIIESKLRFFKPWKSESDAYIKDEGSAKDKSTVVTWGFFGNNKPPSNIFFFF